MIDHCENCDEDRVGNPGAMRQAEKALGKDVHVHAGSPAAGMAVPPGLLSPKIYVSHVLSRILTQSWLTSTLPLLYPAKFSILLGLLIAICAS